MSNTANNDKWIIKDSSGKRYGKAVYETRGDAVADLPKLTESSGGQDLVVVQLLQE